MGHAQGLADLTQIALRVREVSHHAGPGNHSQVGHFREGGQDVVLHAIGEEGVLFCVAHVFERQNGDAFLERARRAATPGPERAPVENEKRDHGEEHADDEEIQLAAGAPGHRFVGGHILGAFQAFRGELEDPGHDQHHRQAENEAKDNQPHRPRWDDENRKNLGRDLDDQPRDDRVGHGRFVNIAPLEFAEEIPRLHFETAGGCHFFRLRPKRLSNASCLAIQLLGSGACASSGSRRSRP